MKLKECFEKRLLRKERSLKVVEFKLREAEKSLLTLKFSDQGTGNVV